MGIVDRWRPETAAGGYARDDEAIRFYTRVRALLRPDMTVLDLGAGRGSRFDRPNGFHARFCNLHGRVRRLVGADVDPVVLRHPALDERHVILPGAPLPFGDASFDMVVCEYVVEHVEDPDLFAREIGRILRPGGWLCALTPNRAGYVGLGNALVPERLKGALLARLWPERQATDAFATFYRLNSRRAFRRAFPAPRWSHHGYTDEATPKYHADRTVPFALVALWQRLAPPAMQTNLVALVRKSDEAPRLAPTETDLRAEAPARTDA